MDRHTWLWPGHTPDIEKAPAAVVRQQAGDDVKRLASLEAVAERMLDITRVRLPADEEKDIGRRLAAAVADCDFWFDEEYGLSAQPDRQLLLLSAGGDESTVGMYRSLARSILSRCRCVGEWGWLILAGVPVDIHPLHVPAVKEALGCLIPEELHPSLDSAARRMKDEGSEMRGSVHMQSDAWRVSVFEDEALSQGRPSWSVMEFFRELLGHICKTLALPLTFGSAHSGKSAALAGSPSALLR